MNRRRTGFTILELLVVISVIGILAALSTFGFSRFQASTRDAQRNAQASVITEGLEKYYDQHGEYPSCPALTNTNASTVTSETLKTVDPLSLKAPSAAAATSNSIQCQSITQSSPTDFFSYTGDGSTTCTTGSSCLNFSLSYKEESTSSIKTIESRRQSSVAAPNGFELAIASPTCSNLTSLTLSWQSVPNNTGYVLYRSLDESLLSDDILDNLATSPNAGVTSLSLSSSATNTTITSLTQGTDYYFRLKANASNGTWVYSSVTYDTTKALIAPDIDITSETSSAIGMSWNATDCATSYTIARASNSAFSSGYSQATGNTTRTASYTGLASNTTYYFRVKAVSGTLESPWSDTADGSTATSCTTVTKAPSNFKVSLLSSGTTARLTWTKPSGTVSSYQIRYSKSSGMGSSSTVTASASATSKDIGNLTPGTKYWFDIRAKTCNSNYATRSGTVSTATKPTKPTNVSITADRPSTVKSDTSPGWMDNVVSNLPYKPGNYYYAYAKAKATCKYGTPYFHFRAEYSANLVNPPGPRYYGNTDTKWATRDAWYLVSPNPGYAARFQVSAGCKSNGVTSATTSYYKSCTGSSGTSSCSNWSGWRSDSDWGGSSTPTFN